MKLFVPDHLETGFIVPVKTDAAHFTVQLVAVGVIHLAQDSVEFRMREIERVVSDGRGQI